ncbi:MAG: LamG-like jellyroll fold domain-containing protein [Verrucomicrobiota bacterium]
MKPEAEKLIARFLAGEAVESELLELCENDQDVLEALSAHAEVERMAAHLGGGQHGAFSDEVVERIRGKYADEPFTSEVIGAIASKRVWWRRQAVWGAIAACLCAALGLTWWWGGASSGSSKTYARVISLESALWSVGGGQLAIDDRLGAMPVELERGYAQLRFDHGTLLLVEGPAKFSILDDKYVKFEYGRAVANVPEAGHGFVIESPDAEIVDLGTKFGVDVREEGETEVHVMQGKVKARGHWEAEYSDLVGNQAKRWNGQSREKEELAVQAQNFLLELPDREFVGERSYLHWGFDEEGGVDCEIEGRGFDLAAGRGRFYFNDEQIYPGEVGVGPQRISGVSGKALRFQGDGGWVKTNFSGVSGGEARTVAFWVKALPEDQMAYAAIGWGEFGPGTVWQISLNPDSEHGPLGRLRLGILSGQLIGKRDLRDGLWHHIAVVMYPGDHDDRAKLTTHTLFYVDGELEMTTQKSFEEVNTLTEEENSKRLMIGRSTAGGRVSTFRGSMDELYVVQGALSQEEIQSLMANDDSFLGD